MAQDNIKDRIGKLYAKFLTGEISKTEYEEMYKLFRQHPHQDWMDSYILPELDEVENQPDAEVQGLILIGSKSKRSRFYKISAAAAVLLLIIASIFIFLNSEPDWIVHTTGYQETREIGLPDGSTVVLNASSELKWMSDFEKSEERLVELRGEGFFDVVHMDGKGFTVRTGSVDVKVLGTQFNLETRRDYTTVFLKEGKVVLETPTQESVEMEPGDLVHYNLEKNQIQKARDQPSDAAVSWKEGVFTFTTLTGIQILDKMEDIYGKEFIVEEKGALSDTIVVQGLPYTDWDFTREALELALEIQLIDSGENEIVVKKK